MGYRIDPKIEARRETVFLILAGTFLSAMTMLNIIGITKFLSLGPLTVAVGVLPYPLTFLCTDLISEFYGKKRANMVVWVGLGLNFFVLSALWFGQYLPEAEISMQPPWQTIEVAKKVALPDGSVLEGSFAFFHLIYACTTGAVFASMVAYMTAQFCDVYIFHYLKTLTNGKHLWLRNNGSTLISQLVDSFMVVSVTFGAAFLSGEMALSALVVLLLSNYAFKFSAALLDTIPFYIISNRLRKFLDIDPNEIY